MSSAVTSEPSDHQDRPPENITLVDRLPGSIARTLTNTKDNEADQNFNRETSNKSEEKDVLTSTRDETIKKGHVVK